MLHRLPSLLRTLLLPWMHCALGLLALGLCGVGCAPVVSGGTPRLQVTEVRPGVFVHIGLVEDWVSSNGGDVANIGFVVGSRCVAVIDTGGTPAVGQALREAVARTTPLPVCYVINTHAHPDHMLGNVAFSSASPKPQFVASARYAATMSAREPYYLKALQRDFGIALSHEGIVYPGIEVAQAQDIDLGDRILSLQAWPTAHTDNDLTVFDRRTRTLFAADLLFVQHLPALDGNLSGWLCAMDALSRFPVATVVPGHGAVSHQWPAALSAQAAYLGGLLRDTRAALKGGQTIAQAVERIQPPAGSGWLLTERFQRRNVTAAYAELEWEDEDTEPRSADKPCMPQPAKADLSTGPSP